MKKKALQNLPKDKAEMYRDAWKAEGASVEMIPQADDLWTVAAIFPDDQAGGGETQKPPHDGGGVEKPPVDETEDDEKLGALSSKYESNGNPATIAWDSTGGWSYGQYQLAANPGAIGEFLEFLDTEHPSYAKALRDAGGEMGARSGSDAFKNAWRGLAKDGEFMKVQHQYVRVKYYDRFAERLKAMGLDIENRSLALRNVAWSVSVQHGSGNNVFANALRGQDLPGMSDKDIIKAVYAERSKVDIHFANSTPQVKSAVSNRFKKELSDALTMLG